MTNLFSDLKPFIHTEKKISEIDKPKKVNKKEYTKMISEMVEIIRENKKIIEENNSVNKQSEFIL